MITSIEFDDAPSYPCETTALHRVTGKLFDRDDEHMADYIVSWPLVSSEKPLSIDFIFREWNEDTEAVEGAVVSVHFHQDEKGLGLRIVDGDVSFLKLEGVHKAYSNQEIREWIPMQQLVQHACQFILVHDDRILLPRS